ncbi:MAG: 3-oxoacyl-[acyl-carrier-protein] reductase [Nitrospirae bacterium]|nr:3-oxoacyl-[acyl-carrier-protein] reductase [Nitrospirota bacterium]
MKPFDGKTALVTGGTRGIGNAIARRLLDLGADVVITGRDRAGAEKAAAELARGGGNCRGVALDVADFGQVEAVIKAIGAVDILVNNAGMTKDDVLMRLKEDDWDAVLDANLKGTFACSRAVIRGMMKKRWGRIVNIGSIVGSMGNIGQANYVAAKAGMEGLTKTLAREYASRGITANVVAPGFIETDMTRSLDDAVRAGLMAQIPMERFGSPEDVAAAVAFLAGDDAAYVTGQVIHVNGGMRM